MATRDPRHAHFVGIVARLWRGSSTTASNADGHETASYKLLAVAAAAYVLLPFDVIPDFIPVVGHFDDAIVVALVFQAARQQWLHKLRRLIRRRRSARQPQVA